MTIEATEYRFFGLKKEKYGTIAAGARFPYRFLTYRRSGEVTVLSDDEIEVRSTNVLGTYIERRSKEEINKRPRVEVPTGRVSGLIFSWRPTQE